MRVDVPYRPPTGTSPRSTTKSHEGRVVKPAAKRVVGTLQKTLGVRDYNAGKKKRSTSTPADALISKSLGNVNDDLVVAFPTLVGKEDDRQRSRMRFVNRNLPPHEQNFVTYGKRAVPRRWR